MAKVTIAGARITKGLTQEQLAREIGVSRSAVQKWESGRADIRFKHLKAISQITGFDIDDFLMPEKYAKCAQNGNI